MASSGTRSPGTSSKTRYLSSAPMYAGSSDFSDIPPPPPFAHRAGPLFCVLCFVFYVSFPIIPSDDSNPHPLRHLPFRPRRLRRQFPQRRHLAASPPRTRGHLPQKTRQAHPLLAPLALPGLRCPHPLVPEYPHPQLARPPRP